jgi:hypothetical protein
MPPCSNSSCQRTPHDPRQGKCSCRVPQHTNFKPRWRRISARQLIEALPKTRLVLVLHLAAHQRQLSAEVHCDATPPQHIMPAEQSTAQDKASARAASRSTPTSIPAIGESLDASRLKHSPRQGQCSCCRSQHINFKAGHPSSANSTMLQLIMPAELALPKTRQVLVPRPAEQRLQTTLAAELIPPADRSTAQDKASALAAPRSTPTSTLRTRPVRCHPSATHHASGAKYCPRQGK